MIKKNLFDKWVSEALREASKLAGQGVKFKNMPKWVQKRIKIFNFWCDLCHPKNFYYRFIIWRFYKKHPYLKEKDE